MRVVMFYHSLVSCWNHGNAHFLRGVAGELAGRGHDVAVYEPVAGWSRRQLRKDHGDAPMRDFAQTFPALQSRLYDPDTIDLDEILGGADVVLVHEWNDPRLVARLGAHRACGGRYRLLFHDTHHRMVSAPEEMARYDLRQYDGVLAFGRVLADRYAKRGLRSWTWHEAADTRLFRPLPTSRFEGDVVWIGNWGDGERSDEIRAMLIEPVRRLKLKARVYGVRWPDSALRELDSAGIEYGGWLANARVPEVFARYRMTVHVPRSYYRRQIPGVPTIRVFEALACGIPLVCLRWRDSENLFRPGTDYLEVDDGDQMADAMTRILEDPALSRSLSQCGLESVLRRHTCAHRVDELLRILAVLDAERTASRQGAAL